MKHYEVYLEPVQEEFMGVVEAEDKEQALEMVEQGDYTENFKYAPEQRSYELREVKQEQYERAKQYSEGT